MVYYVDPTKPPPAVLETVRLLVACYKLAYNTITRRLTERTGFGVTLVTSATSTNFSKSAWETTSVGT
eukprot:3480795-Amphidinium_carterae.3